jgi:hypothetical protein
VVFLQRGFSIDAANFNQIKKLGSLFEPYLHKFVKVILVLILVHCKSKHIVKVGLQPDSQRYFDYHHASNDTFDAVHKELED